MTRGELRTIARHRFTKEENAAIGDAEFNSLVNQGRVQLCHDIEGTLTAGTLTAAAGGICTLPATHIATRRIDYGGIKMSKTDLSSLYDKTGGTDDTGWATTGEYYYSYGHNKIATYMPVATGASVSILYEAAPADLSLDKSADTSDVDIPISWTQALIDFIVWKAIPIVRASLPGKTDLRDEAYAEQVFYRSTRNAGKTIDNSTSQTGPVPRGPHF